MPSSTDLARLRARIATLEGVGGEAVPGAVALGLPELDAILPWGGLALGCLHEVTGVPYGDGVGDGAATAFSAVLLGRLAAATARPALWIGHGDMPYAPGLATLGLRPEHVVLVRTYRAAQSLWALEEGVRCRALAGVLAEVWEVDLTAARRLQLAAKASGVPALLLNHGPPCGAAVTRWRVGTSPSRGDPALGVGPWCWKVELLRCRGRGVNEQGRVAAWEVEWDEQARGLRLAAPAADRAVTPQRFRAVG